MKLIHKLIDGIHEELEGAKEYAEKYIDAKARGNVTRANKYAEMASDELKHATYIKDFAVMDIDEIKKVYPLPVELEEEWEHAHKKFIECMAIIKHMLSM
jgi:hypothetical protein